MSTQSALVGAGNVAPPPRVPIGSALADTIVGSKVTLVADACWLKDYTKYVDSMPVGKYFKRYNADGVEDTNAGPTQFKATIKIPLKTKDKLTVTLKMKASAMDGVTDEELTASKKKFEDGVAAQWNDKFKLAIEDNPNCGTRTLDVVFKIKWVPFLGADYVLQVVKNEIREFVRSDEIHMHVASKAWTYGHEFGHCLGLPDEYSYDRPLLGANGVVTRAARDEFVAYIKPDGMPDTKITVPAMKAGEGSTVMSTHSDTKVLARHMWFLAIEVQAILKSKIGRTVKCSVVL